MRDFSLPGRSAVFATNGMAATSHPLASQTAVALLEAGGNAIDAAIGAAVLLGICEPQMTGIGGDCFALFTPPGEDRVIALNGSGRAPAGFDAARLRAEGHGTIPPGTAHTVTLPGAVAGFCRLSRDWGRLPLAQVLAPAIAHAEAGVPIAPRVAHDIATAHGTLKGAARAAFLPSGRPPAAGELFALPAQAEVLRRIAAEGARGFYEGEVAADMVASLNAAGGAHTEEDFAAVTADYAEPVSGQYGPFELLEHPPNGQGATAILLLNILRRFDLAAMAPFGAERAHIEAEATKLAYDARNRILADPDHTARLEHMLAPETATRLAALIDPARCLGPVAPLTEQVHRDTVYLTVVDGDRMAVSLIYSIFSSFGSGIASDRYGILFHDRGAGFTLEKGLPNEAGPGKRPLHTIIPGILRQEGRVAVPFGVMGGPYQACGHARFVTNLVDFGLDLQTAIDTPRCFPWEGRLRIERGYAPEVRQALADLGHDLEVPETGIGGAQAIRIRADGVLEGASDPRKDGCALGY